jgi:hypothetical protein
MSSAVEIGLNGDLDEPVAEVRSSNGGAMLLILLFKAARVPTSEALSGVFMAIVSIDFCICMLSFLHFYLIV